MGLRNEFNQYRDDKRCSKLKKGKEGDNWIKTKGKGMEYADARKLPRLLCFGQKTLSVEDKIRKGKKINGPVGGLAALLKTAKAVV